MQIRIELQEMLQEVGTGRFWTHSPFDRTPASLRRLNDVAFSGDGEPTACRQLHRVCKDVVEVLYQSRIPQVNIILITNATLLHQPHVIQSLQFLDQYQGQVWAKLDAGTESYYRMINRSRVPLERVLNNILHTGRQRPIVIQSMFIGFNGQAVPATEIEAYVARLKWLNDQGCQIRLVQAYTVARPTACDSVRPISSQTLDFIAERVRRIGLNAEVYDAPANFMTNGSA